MHVYRLIVMYPSTHDKNISTTKNPQKWLKKVSYRREEERCVLPV